jgi:hypothetical protein
MQSQDGHIPRPTEVSDGNNELDLETRLTNHRVRYQVSSAGPVNWSAEGNKLAAMIKQYSLSDNSDSLFVN